MKNFKIISATEARNKWFEILNWVNLERKEVWIKKRKTIIVRIVPGERPKISKADEVIANTFGYLKEKKGFFPYQENKKVIARERKTNNYDKLWKNK